MNIDYTKYDRFFTFGCSFTGYKYPTWANVMSRNLPKARFYNFGQSGGGNMFIASRITEANRKFNFTDTDLIMVMNSTYCREDRYVRDRGWVTPGNIYTQAEYDYTDSSYLCNWGHPITYLVRDLALIDITDTYLKYLPCDSISMLSVPFNYQQDDTEFVREILDIYSDLAARFPPNMFEEEMNSTWGYSCEYYNGGNSMFKDYHPSTEQYCNYLEKIGIEMSNEATDFARNATQILSQIRDEKQFAIAFPNVDPRIMKRERLI